MERSDVFVDAVSRLERIAEEAGVSREIVDALRNPSSTHIATLPVRMDDGATHHFQAFRCRYSDFLGPAKGGIRYHPGVTRAEVQALALWMTLQVRGGRHSLRRRQGRRRGRSQEPVSVGARTPLASLHAGHGGRDRPGSGRSGSRRVYERADHGLDGRRVPGDPPCQGAVRDHREADRARRVPGPRRGDGGGVRSSFSRTSRSAADWTRRTRVWRSRASGTRGHRWAASSRKRDIAS